jgi:hypothetical protein
MNHDVQPPSRRTRRKSDQPAAPSTSTRHRPAGSFGTTEPGADSTVDARLRVVWFVIITLTAVLAAAIAAVVTSALGAGALVVLSSAAGVFLAIFGLGVKVYDFFRAP